MTRIRPRRDENRAGAVAAAGALLLLLIGVPLVLAAATGLPWPQRTTGLDDLLDRLAQPPTDPLMVQILALLGWLTWAAMLTTLAREAVWYLRNLVHLRADGDLHRAHLETLNVPRLVAALCVGTVVVAVLATLRTATASALVPPATAVSLKATNTIAEEPEIRQHTAYTVRPGDTLWEIAGRCLDDPIRWPEIYALSTDLAQPDGGRLTNPDLLRPGWTLHLPVEAEPPPPSEDRPDESTDHPGAPQEAEEEDTVKAPEVGAPRPVHVPLGPAALIGVTLAAGITAAVARSRLRARRHHDADLTVDTAPAPLSSAVRNATHATLAAIRAERDQAEAAEAEITRRPPSAAPAPPGTITIAHRDHTELDINALATPGGWSFHGDGAPAAARALIVSTLTAAQCSPARPLAARLIAPRTLLAALLPASAETVGRLPGCIRANDDQEALRIAQSGSIRRARLRDTEAPPDEAAPMDILLLHTNVPPEAATFAADAAPGELAVLHFGDRQLGNAAELTADGTVRHHTGPHGPALRGAQLFTLTAQTASELLDCLQPESSQNEPPSIPPQSDKHDSGIGPGIVSIHQNRTDVVEREDNSREPPVRVRLLGGMSLFIREEENPLGMKEAAKEFLAILAAHPQGLRNDTLTELLRLSTTPEQATKDLVNLRRAVRRTLRQATESRSAAFVLQTADRHRLDPQLVRSDATDFTHAIETARRTREPEARTQALERAIDLYQGPLCDGADYPWADELRQWLHHKAIDAAILLADHHTTHSEDHHQARNLLERAAGWEPTSEPICQRLMRLHLKNGHPEAAHHAYQRLARHLKEIGVRPGDTTRSLLTPPTPRTPPPRSTRPPAAPTRPAPSRR
ncbi:BTAD domain-containing putative transcriptional regulator [Streptomyces sp. NBRC 109706]|uniref:BTAD domain-containing putative transcriptional regulator n=1 Tax=Streptomyces sp. NBRC 109706 TaxID=1550035 RepID=UPI000AEB163D|nr:BTAD domain-containing putative transcriptional regulator [Streptomyces sp. NBRC 109706]